MAGEKKKKTVQLKSKSSQLGIRQESEENQTWSVDFPSYQQTLKSLISFLPNTIFHNPQD